MAIKFQLFSRESAPGAGADAARKGWVSRWFSGWTVAQLLGVITIVVIVGAFGKLGVGYGLLPSPDFPTTSGGAWQAVFLTNNQVYFGHLVNYDRTYALLRNVFYIQVSSSQNLQPETPGAAPQLNLIKLGGELHGPEDAMFIPKDKILFWENMKADSQVVKAIQATAK